MTLRDAVTMLALLLVLLMAGTARSQPPAQETDILSILNGTNPVVRSVMDDGLEDVDRAAAKLESTHQSSNVETTRGQREHESLGIGDIGEKMEKLGLPAHVDFLPDPARVRAEAVVAKTTSRVGECYGDPMRDASSRYDSLVVRVIIDPEGEVVAVRVIQPTRFGQRGTETCVSDALEGIRFPKGLTETVAQVGYRWTFDLGGSCQFRFAAK